jgi:hypothetical protein
MILLSTMSTLGGMYSIILLLLNGDLGLSFPLSCSDCANRYYMPFTTLLVAALLPYRTLSEPAPTRYADKAARAGGFMSASSTNTAPWQVVQPAEPGMKQLEYRLLRSAGVNLPNTMWYV